ncbi:crotonase/enoyl-CoA hydratase family protein [Alloalcanivorax sp. C16-1]|uniref:crotonase/enoyl-CoA hydratase family protein n=1 Tax=Alloalcanivorax sp. C16-1 TaxID=3390051 RepID=UPI0039706D22
MPTSSVVTETDGAIRTIIINRPGKRNAVDAPTAEALRAAFLAFDADDSVRVAVLTGAGAHFCAGADLTALGDPQRRNRVEAEGTGPGPMGPTRLRLSKPVIAAVSGYAVAGGLELALLCDLRVVDRSAVFGVFCRRWGVPLIDGGTVRLPRLIGQSHALDMILTGRPVDADEALRIGLANRLSEGDALHDARALARRIAGFPQQCMNADRASVHAQWDYPLDEALRREGAGGFPIVFEEALAGADRFAKGAGRHGKFEDSDLDQGYDSTGSTMERDDEH